MSRIGEGLRGRKITDMSFNLRDVNSSMSGSDIKNQTGCSFFVCVMQGELRTVVFDLQHPYQYRTVQNNSRKP